MDGFRVYFKPNGSNPEVDSCFYELASHQEIHGLFNCEIMSLGFVRGALGDRLRFRPLNLDRPIVFAVDSVLEGRDFIVIDVHLKKDAREGMKNFKPFKSDDFLIDCSEHCIVDKKPEYWSVTSQGMRFVYGDTDFPDTWKIEDCDLLCALVGGELTPNQLRAKAYLMAREAKKEQSRQDRIQEFSYELFRKTARMKAFRQDLRRALSSRWPLVSKGRIDAVLLDYTNR